MVFVNQINSKKNGILPGLTVICLFVMQTLAAKTGSLVAGQFNYADIDPDGLFLPLCVHHIVQAMIALVFIFILSRIKMFSFNLAPKFSELGIKYTVIFSAVIFVYAIVFHIVGYQLGTLAPYNYELNARNCFGYLGFQLLLSGPSEEILFRALPITVLCPFDTKSKNQWIIIASVLFGIAHIGWSFNPPALFVSWFQVVYAFILGIVYGITYIKSKSIIYPMIMHSMSNVIMVGVGYLLYIVMVM